MACRLPGFPILMSRSNVLVDVGVHIHAFIIFASVILSEIAGAFVLETGELSWPSRAVL